jgi:hypothetical protein
MEGSLEKISFARIFRIEQFKKLNMLAKARLIAIAIAAYLQYKLVINICLGNVGVEILALDESQEELVHDLNVRPCNFQNRLVLLRIKSFTLRIDRWRDRAEQILAEHIDHSWVHRLGDD